MLNAHAVTSELKPADNGRTLTRMSVAAVKAYAQQKRGRQRPTNDIEHVLVLPGADQRFDRAWRLWVKFALDGHGGRPQTLGAWDR